MILILGRFQPLHNGHMKVMRDAYKDDNDLVIAVGSASRNKEKDNPFSGEERKEMIERTLNAEDIKARVVLVPNIPSDTYYAEHVEKQIGAKPDKVITENPWSIDVFKRAGYEVQVTKRHFEISSTQIRQHMADGKPWEDLVPREVFRYLKEIDGEERVKELHKT